MPIYEYSCRACHQHFERFVRPSSSGPEEVLRCPACQSTDLERLLSMFAVNSEGTQQAHLQHARKLGMKEHREKKHAEAEVIRHIHEDHDH